MKLPIPFFLYVIALGLFGLAGWTFYGMLPMWKEQARIAASQRGLDQSRSLIDKGRGQGTVNVDWVYSASTAPWWSSFKEANLVGKLPPPPPDVTTTVVAPPPVTVSMQPLEEIFEIVALVHDEQEGDAKSYAIVRYKPTVKVDPPEWWILENTPPAAIAGGAPVRDTSPAAAPGRTVRGPQNPQGRNRGGQPAPSNPMPTSGLTGREILQRVYVRDFDERHSSHLWPEFAHIRLVRVADDAGSAWFVRDIPPAKEGETPPAPKEEQFFKTSQNLSQDVMRALNEINGDRGGPPIESSATGAAPSNGWVDVEETMQDGNTFHIGRKDERSFQENQDFFDRLDVDVYRGSSMKGLIVRNVDAKLAAKFGIQPGEVLLEVNGQPVESKAKALQVGKTQYKRGVRTFVTKWLSNGSVVERTYQAPNK